MPPRGPWPAFYCFPAPFPGDYPSASSAHVSRGIVFGEHSASFVTASSGGTGEEKARVAPLPRGKGASRIALPRTSANLAGNTA